MPALPVPWKHEKPSAIVFIINGTQTDCRSKSQVGSNDESTPPLYTYFQSRKKPSTLQPTLHSLWYSAEKWLKGLISKPFRPFSQPFSYGKSGSTKNVTSQGLAQAGQRLGQAWQLGRLLRQSSYFFCMYKEAPEGAWMPKAICQAETSWRVWNLNHSAIFLLIIRENEGLAEGLKDFYRVKFAYI